MRAINFLVCSLTFTCLLYTTIRANDLSDKIDSLKQEYARANSSYAKAQLANKLAIGYNPMDFDSVNYYSKKAISYARSADTPLELVQALGSQFVYFVRKNDWDSAKFCCDEMIKTAEHHNDSAMRFIAYYNTGTYFYKRQSNQDATESFLKAMEFSRDSNDYYLGLFRLASIQQSSEANEEALEKMSTAFRYYHLRQGRSGNFTYNAFIGMLGCLSNLDRSQEMKDQIDQYGYLFMDGGMKQAAISMYLGQSEYILGNCSDAVSHLEYADSVFSSRNLIGVSITVKFSMVEALQCDELFEQARSLLETTKDYIDKNDRVEERKMYFRRSYILAAAAGDYERAYNDFKALDEFQDSIRMDETADEIEKLKLEFDEKNYQNQIALQNAKLQTQQSQIKTRNWMLGGIGVSLTLLFLFGYGQYKRRQEKSKAEKEMAVMRGKWEAMETLRSKISKDLHDGVGYNMQMVASQVESLSDQSDQTKTFLQDIQHTEDKIRSIAYELFPGELQKVSLKKAVELHIEKTQNASDTDFYLSIFPNDALDGISSETATALYRILQECSSNTLKYAQAKNVEVHFTLLDEGLSFMFEDNGVGFDPDQVEHGSGLHNMKARCTNLGASFHLDTKKGRGTIINIDFPLSSAHA